jgi:hypothetical protein
MCPPTPLFCKRDVYPAFNCRTYLPIWRIAEKLAEGGELRSEEAGARTVGHAVVILEGKGL